MKEKLTLSLDKMTIAKAKAYAKINNQNLSQIIESYLVKITSKNTELGDPELDALRGIIILAKDFDIKKESRKLSIKKQLI